MTIIDAKILALLARRASAGPQHRRTESAEIEALFADMTMCRGAGTGPKP